MCNITQKIEYTSALPDRELLHRHADKAYRDDYFSRCTSHHQPRQVIRRMGPRQPRVNLPGRRGAHVRPRDGQYLNVFPLIKILLNA